MYVLIHEAFLKWPHAGKGMRWAVDGSRGNIQVEADAEFARLEAAILEACDQSAEWPAKRAAGIYAAIEFATANPVATRTLILGDRSGDTDSSRYLRMIDRFSELLGEGDPRDERRLPASTNQALVGGMVTVVADHVRSGRMDRLGEIAPDLVCFTLLPYLGFDEAKRWAQSTAPASWTGM